MFWAYHPIVHLYAVCWNEAHMLPFFFRHYEPWVQRFVIYDNGSTDGTLELLAAKRNVEVRTFPWTDPNSFVQSHRTLHNNCWRESRGSADWVVVTAIDEHVYHPRMSRYLRRRGREGVTCLPALGFHMVTREFPGAHEHLANTRTHGMPTMRMSKLRLFNPDAVEPNVEIGGHGAEPTGRVIYPWRDEVLLLHYKNLGMEYLAERNKLLATGLRDGDRANKWGVHYGMDRAELERHFDHLWRHAVDIRDPGYVPWRDHAEPRFWQFGHRATRRHPRLHRLWRRVRRMLRRGR